MVTQQPHYLLICDSVISNPALIDGVTQPTIGLGRWNFVLERIDGPERLEAQDCENYIHQDRLALLAVVRGLEALEQSSIVRLVTTSRYVDRGMRFGLPNWRETSYQWESFGMRKPVRNADLWRRVDVAMQYHEIACRLLKSSIGMVEANAEEFAAELSQVAPTVQLVASMSVPATASGALQVGAPIVAQPIPHPFGVSAAPSLAACLADDHGASVERRATKIQVANDSMVKDPMSKHRGAALSTSRVAYRVDSAHRTASPAGFSKFSSPQADNKPKRLQWWEMASKWDNPLTIPTFPQAAGCGT